MAVVGVLVAVVASLVAVTLAQAATVAGFAVDAQIQRQGASEDWADGRLVCPLPQILNGNEGYWFVYPSPRAAWPKIRRFSEWLHRLVARSALRSYPEVSALRAA